MTGWVKTVQGALAAATLVACQPIIVPFAAAPEIRRAPGKTTCITTYTRPAVIETQTTHKLVRPAKPARNGKPAQPAEYKSQTRQVIVEERQSRPVDTPCPETMTPEFIASLQRALKVRGIYTGPETGMLDRETRDAIRAYQKLRGIDWDWLTLDTARSLGLSEVPLD